MRIWREVLRAPTRLRVAASALSALALIAVTSSSAGATYVLETEAVVPGSALAMSHDGMTTIFGDPGQEKVAVYRRIEGGWVADGGYTWPSNPNSPRDIGSAVALSANGTRMVVGGYFSEAAWVLDWTGKDWAIEKSFTGPNGGFFGRSVSMSADGSTIAVGAPEAEAGRGAAWLFHDGPEGWSGAMRLNAGTEPYAAVNGYGSSIALASDGSFALVSSPRSYSPFSSHGGLAWIASGFTPVEMSPLPQPSDSSGEQTRFGEGLTLSSDGTTAAVGAPGDAQRRGAVWTYRRSGDGQWTQEGAKHVAGKATGFSEALSGNGDILLMGAGEFGSGNGSAAVLERSPTAWPTKPTKLPFKVRSRPLIVGITGDGSRGVVYDGEHAYFLNAEPAIGKVNPAKGTADAQTEVVLTGSGFVGVEGVTVAGQPASFEVDSPTQITAITPPMGSGAVDIRIVTQTGISALSKHDRFTYR